MSGLLGVMVGFSHRRQSKISRGNLVRALCAVSSSEGGQGYGVLAIEIVGLVYVVSLDSR